MNMIVTTSYISREPSNERAYESEHIYKCRSSEINDFGSSFENYGAIGCFLVTLTIDEKHTS